jgi:hypothetical protein
MVGRELKTLNVYSLVIVLLTNKESAFLNQENQKFSECFLLWSRNLARAKLFHV